MQIFTWLSLGTLHALLVDTRLCSSFTAFNCIMLLSLTACERCRVLAQYTEEMWPVFALTTYVTIASFYALGYVWDRSFYGRLMTANEWTNYHFVSGDLAFHVFPAACMAYSHMFQRERWVEAFATNPYFMLDAIFMNLLWAAVHNRGTFDLSRSYVPCDVSTWTAAWMTAIALYVCIGFQLSRHFGVILAGDSTTAVVVHVPGSVTGTTAT